MKKEKTKEQKNHRDKLNTLYQPIHKKLNRYKNNLIDKITPSEKFRQKLIELKIKHKFQKAFFNKNFRCIVDFYITVSYLKVCIEIDGDYHNTEEQQKKDKYRSDWIIENRGCHIIRFTNNQVMNNIDHCIHEIALFFINNSTQKDSDNYKKFFELLWK